jgi:hypothetical protein
MSCTSFSRALRCAAVSGLGAAGPGALLLLLLLLLLRRPLLGRLGQ